MLFLSKNIEEHATAAENLRHPHAAAMQQLPELWLYVFAQKQHGMRQWGISNMAFRLNEHRKRMMPWVRALAGELAPLQVEMRVAMPSSAAIVSGQVPSHLLFTLLLLTHYP